MGGGGAVMGGGVGEQRVGLGTWRTGADGVRRESGPVSRRHPLGAWVSGCFHVVGFSLVGGVGGGFLTMS